MLWKHPASYPTIHIWCRIYQLRWSLPLAWLKRSWWWSSRCRRNTKSTSSVPVASVNSVVQMLKQDVLHCHDLDLWPMTLTFELSLDMLRPHLHVKIQVCMSLRSARIVRRTDGHTHRQTDRHTMSKLLHPLLTLGVIKTPERWRSDSYIVSRAK